MPKAYSVILEHAKNIHSAIFNGIKAHNAITQTCQKLTVHTKNGQKHTVWKLQHDKIQAVHY